MLSMVILMRGLLARSLPRGASRWLAIALAIFLAESSAQMQDLGRSVQPQANSEMTGRQAYRQPTSTIIDRTAYRVALLIGVGAYSHMPALANPVRDIRVVCDRLRQFAFDAECLEDVRTRREMRSAIARFVGKMKPGAVALFYFAGHGVQKRGENFLLPAEALVDRASDVDDEGVPLGYLMESVAEAKPALNLVLIDACRDSMGERTRALALPRGFAAIDAPVNTAVLYSTAPGGLALDGGRGAAANFSPFAYEWIKRLNDDSSSLDDIFKGVIAGVQVATSGKQVPWLNSSFAGSFCFGNCPQVLPESDFQRIAEERRQVEARIREMEAERERREADLARMSVRVRDLEVQTAARQQELDNLRVAGRQSTPAYSSQSDRLLQELADLRQANSELMRESVAASAQRVEARRLELLSKELADRMRQVEALQSDNSRLRRKTDDLNKEIDALQSKERASATRNVSEPAKPPPPPAAF